MLAVHSNLKHSTDSDIAKALQPYEKNSRYHIKEDKIRYSKAIHTHRAEQEAEFTVIVATSQAIQKRSY